MNLPIRLIRSLGQWLSPDIAEMFECARSANQCQLVNPKLQELTTRKVFKNYNFIKFKWLQQPINGLLNRSRGNNSYPGFESRPLRFCANNALFSAKTSLNVIFSRCYKQCDGLN